MIVERDGKFLVLAQDGKTVLGTYGDRAAAVRRLAQIEFFKGQHEEAQALSLQQSTELFAMVFDRQLHTVETAKAYCREHGLEAATIVETEDQIMVVQTPAGQFDPSTVFQKIEIAEGIVALFGQVDDGQTRQSVESRERITLGIDDELEHDPKVAVSRWRVTIMQAGESLDRKHLFPDEVLRAAVERGLFNECRVFQFEYNGRLDHLRPETEDLVLPTGVFKNYCGFMSDVEWDQEGGRIIAVLNIVDPVVAQKVRLIKQAGVNHAGLSIVGDVLKVPAILSNGRSGFKITDIIRIKQTDIVSFPAAGGVIEQELAASLQRFVASLDTVSIPEAQDPKTTSPSGGDHPMKELIEKIRQALARVAASHIKESTTFAGETFDAIKQSALDVINGIPATALKQAVDVEMLNKLKEAIMSSTGPQEAFDKVEAILKSADETAQSKPTAPAAPAPAPAPVQQSGTGAPTASAAEVQALTNTVEALKQSLEVERCANVLENRMASVRGLNDGARKLLKRQFRDRVFQSIELDEAIALVAEAQGGDIRLSAGTAEVTGDFRDKLQARMHLTLGGELTADEKARLGNIRGWSGIRQAYFDLTGDENVSGTPDMSRVSSDIRQSMTTADFVSMLGNTLNRAMTQDYARRTNMFDEIVAYANARDFKPQEAVRYGGFSDLPAVVEDIDYVDLATPSEEKATYTVTKRGAFIAVTREMVINDDVSFIASLPKRGAAAANRTLVKFIAALLTGRAGGGAFNTDLTSYDASVIYSVAHANLVAANLSYDNLDAAIIKLVSQVELDSGEVLNLSPANLVVPPQLRSLAKVLYASKWKPGATNEEMNVHEGEAKPIECPYLGSTTASILVAKKDDVETVEVGFLQGRRQPEFIYQGGATEGNVFAKDSLRWKMRHEYSGTVKDHRGLVLLMAP